MMKQEVINMSRYESYKDSGVEWLGDIPSSWNVKPGMIAFSENKRNNKGMKEDKVLSLSYGNIVVKPPEKLTGLVPESFETYQLVEPGDIIVRCMDLQNDKESLRFGLAADAGIITSAYLNLNVRNGFHSKFLFYYFQSLDFTKVIYKFGSGLRQNLSFLDFRRLPIFEIPECEQTAITNFIDHKTTQIDQAIAIKEKQIELLQERKQILIQNAVTRGLDPAVKMKDSGVEWIGEVPVHWALLPNRHIFKLKKIQVGKKSKAYTLLSLTLNGVIKRDMVNPQGKFPAEFDTYQEVNQGDFIFCLFDVEETPRAVGLSPFHGMITGAYTVFETVNSFNKEFLYYFYLYLDANKMMRPLYKGLRNTIPKDRFFEFKSFIPPLSEQQSIVMYIEAESKKTDAAIYLQLQQIEKLKEYKTTLINSAVTGKIKVV